MPLLLSLGAAVAAVLSYRLLEGVAVRSWLPAACRAAAWAIVVLLLVNGSCPGSPASRRPAVLLDASLSMQAAGGRWAEALALARSTGTVRLVGALPGDTTASGGRSRLAQAISGARTGGGELVVVTDGEIEDADLLPADLLADVTLRVLPRATVADVALIRVSGTARLTTGDSLRIEVEAQATGPRPTAPLRVEVREGDRIWLRAPLPIDAGGRARVVLNGPIPAGVAPGAHVLAVALAGGTDAEPRDDARLVVVSIVPTPGIVVLASPPTWESRFLLDALREVGALPVRGYVETERDRWRRAGDLKAVSTVEVAEAARRADVLVTLGNPGAVANGSRARGRWVWPQTNSASIPGDWYVSVPLGTPVSTAFSGLAPDSFPPGTAIGELIPGPRDWVGLSAQAGRRGTVRPVLFGRDSAGARRIVVGMDGLWRWTFQGGSSEQGYRALVASGLAWLLGATDSTSGRARLLHTVVQRGRPASFQWSGPGSSSPIALTLSGSAGVRNDTLVFDGSGRADLLLPPGVWRYQLAGGGQGTLAVEEYSDEWIASAPTLSSQEVQRTPSNPRIPLRAAVWLFGIAIVAFAGEWLARRRLGLR